MPIYNDQDFQNRRLEMSAATSGFGNASYINPAMHGLGGSDATCESLSSEYSTLVDFVRQAGVTGKSYSELSGSKFNGENPLQSELNENKSLKMAVVVDDIDFAGYLLARATDHRTIDGNVLDGLRKANNTVNETREWLRHGRGNVDADLDKSREPAWRTEFCRSHSEAGSDRAVAMAMKMGAGYCGEHAKVAIALHADKLDVGETVHHRSLKFGDHAWAECQLPNGDRVIMDAWCDGPAVMAEDGEFRQRISHEPWYSMKPLDQYTGKQFAQRVKNCYEEIAVSVRLDREWEKERDRLQANDDRSHPSTLWSSMSVVHKDFKSNVSNQQDAANLRTTLLNEKVHINEDLLTSQIKLGRELRAVGVAHTLGTNLKQALNIKDKILVAMDALVR
ncbi:hypothetical protein [Burkholderia pyrrocinia]